MNMPFNASGDRLVNAIHAASPDLTTSWEMLPQKMEAIALTDAEYDYFCNALKTSPDAALLADFYAHGIWDRDRSFLHVMTRSLPYIVQIIRFAADSDKRKPTAAVRKHFQSSIHHAWIEASRENKISDAEYDEMSRYINAVYLADVMYLSQLVRSKLAMERDVIFSLMENEEVILPALETIIKVWETARQSRSQNKYLSIDNVLSIARFLGQCPDKAEALIAFTAERGFYSHATARDYALSSTPALREGVL